MKEQPQKRKHQLQLERWSSNQNKREVHLFIKGRPDKYVMGFNPHIFREKEILALLEKCGIQERPEWAKMEKHKCHTITDLLTPVGTKIRRMRIGKNRFLKVIPKQYALEELETRTMGE